MLEVMDLISQDMSSLGLNYAFLEFQETPTSPYFIGEYREVDLSERETREDSGIVETIFTIHGYTDGTWEQLEIAKEAIENNYPIYGKSSITTLGVGVAISYMGSTFVPTGVGTPNKIQINLKIKEWKV